MTAPQAVCGDTAYTIEGAGPPAVLVHGTGAQLPYLGLAEDPPAINANLVPFLEETLLG